MKRDSVLGLHEEIFRKLFRFEALPMAVATGAGPALYVDPVLMDPGEAQKRTHARARSRMVEDVALGISAPVKSRPEDKQPQDERLAVLVQNRRDLGSTVVADILNLAKGEVEVIYVGRQRPFWTRLRNAPIRLGCSTSPASVTYSGTLGCFCRDKVTGTDGILSNNHVFADVNQLGKGTRIVQAAIGDGGQAIVDEIGQLERFVPIQFGGLPNTVDAAFAVLGGHGRGEDRGSVFDNRVPPVAVVTLQPTNKATALPNVDVLKTGRSSGHTMGRVRAINVNNLVVNMGVGVARFDGQIAFEARSAGQPAFGAPGDSGSLIVDHQGRPMALLFAGSASGGVGNLGIIHGNPISVVEAQLAVDIV